MQRTPKTKTSGNIRNKLGNIDIATENIAQMAEEGSAKLKRSREVMEEEQEMKREEHKLKMRLLTLDVEQSIAFQCSRMEAISQEMKNKNEEHIKAMAILQMTLNTKELEYAVQQKNLGDVSHE